MKRMIIPMITTLMIIIFNGCEWIDDLPSERSYEEKIVLNGMLIAGTPIDSSAFTSTIKLHRSADITEPYDEISVVLESATVTLEDGDSTYTLLMYDDLPGEFYHPTLIIQTGLTYSINVSDDIHEPVTATTMVPSALQITDIMVDDSLRESIGTVVYKPAIGDDVGFLNPSQFTFRLSPVNPDNPPALARIINTALQPGKSTMIMEDDDFKAQIFKWDGIPEDSLEQRIYYRQTISFNSINTDDELIMSWTWFGFYGDQNLTVFALDDAYYRYHKGNLEGPPGDPNYMPESNVIGGYGLFSSANLGEFPNFTSMDWRLIRP